MAPAPERVPARAPPPGPYRGILPFRYADRELFFGREAAVDDLFAKVLVSRLTLLFGESQTGKSSLIHAGLVPALEREGLHAEILRVQPIEEEPIRLDRIWRGRSPEEGFLPSIFVPQPGGARTWPLTLDMLEDRLLEKALEFRPVLIFDQFEELFTLFGRDRSNPEARARELALQEGILDAIFGCVANYDLRAKVVIIIREDFLGKLEALKERHPQIFDYRVRLRFLEPSEAGRAILGPFEKAPAESSRLSDELAGVIVNDLARTGPKETIHPTHLQIVCDSLWSKYAGKTETIGEDEYRKLGRVKGILEGFLRTKLEMLGPRRTTAILILGNLVTEEETRDVVGIGKLKGLLKPESEAEEEEFASTLESLEKFRLINRSDQRETMFYEVASEYLIPAIQRERHAVELAQERERIRAETDQERIDRQKKLLRTQRLAFVAIALTALFVLLSAGLFFVSLRATRAEDRATKLAEQLEMIVKEREGTIRERDEALEKESEAIETVRGLLKDQQIIAAKAALAARDARIAEDKATKAAKGEAEAAERARESDKEARALLAVAERQFAEKVLAEEKARQQAADADNARRLAEAQRMAASSVARQSESEIPAAAEEALTAYRQWVKHEGDPADHRMDGALRRALVRLRLFLFENRSRGEHRSAHWQIEHDREAGSYRFDAAIRAVSIEPAGRWAFTGGDDGSVQLLDLGWLISGSGSPTLCPVETFGGGVRFPAERGDRDPAGYGVRGLSASGSRLAAGSASGEIGLWALDPLAGDAGTDGCPRPTRLRTESVGASHFSESFMLGLDASELSLLANLDYLGGDFLLAYRRKLADPEDPATTRWSADVWHLPLTEAWGQPRELARFDAPSSSIPSVALGSDGKLLVVGTVDGTLVWPDWKIAEDAPDPATLCAVPGGESIYSVAVDDVGSFLACGTSAGEVLVQSLALNGSAAMRLGSHPSGVTALSFGRADDGALTLASGSFDGGIQLWRLDAEVLAGEKTISPPTALPGHDGWVWSLAFRPGGEHLVSGGTDRRLRVWQTRTEKLAEEICQIHRGISREICPHSQVQEIRDSR